MVRNGEIIASGVGAEAGEFHLRPPPIEERRDRMAGETGDDGYLMAPETTAFLAPKWTPMHPPALPLDPLLLLDRHRGQIERLVRRLVDPADRDDVTQELLLAAIERPPRSASILPAWIRTTLRNLAAKRLRSQQRRRRREAVGATAEALPSSVELVGRLDLEEQLLRAVRELAAPERDVVLLRYFEGRSAVDIAVALHLGESTVRARLARAVEQMRARLDGASPQGRHGWVAVLAPWALPLLPSAAVVAGTVAGGAAISGATSSAPIAAAATFALSEKVLVAAAATFLVLGGLSLVLQSQARLAPRLPEFSAAVDAASAHAESDVAALPIEVERVPVASGDRDALPSAGAGRAPATTRPSGILRLHVVSAATGEVIEGATLRALSSDRFAATELRPLTAELCLSAGSFDVLVEARGYESQLFRAVEITADATHVLGTVALRRGNATLNGRVLRVGEAAARRGWIELRGEGRGPCPRCGSVSTDEAATIDDALGCTEPSPHPVSPCCGWFWDRSLVEVDEEGSFRFERLAAGWYFVRPLDEQARLQPTVAVHLESGQPLSLDLELAPAVALHLRLFDEDGAPFTGRWSVDSQDEPPPVQFDLTFEHTSVTLDGGTDAAAVRARFGPPPREGLGELGPPESEDEPGVVTRAEVSVGSALLSQLRFPPENVLDRARVDSDTLLVPQPPTPGFAGCEFTLARLAPNHFVLTRLPAGRCRFVVRCVDFASEPFEVDLADPRDSLRDVVLRPRPHSR